MELFDRIDGITELYHKLWIDLCMMETRSDDVEALNAQADLLCYFANEHGLLTDRIRFPEGGGDALIFTLSGYGVPEESAPVALLGHMDTVHEKGAFGKIPVHERNGRIYGPGVADMKGGLCVALLAMEGLRLSGVPHRAVRLIINPDEESGEHIGMKNRRELFTENAKGCIAAFNCETGCEGSLTVGRKGVLRIVIDIEGIGGHAGNAYFESASAIREAAYKVIELEKQSVPGGMTINCGIIEGGTVVNIIPTHCRISLDIRFLNEGMKEEAIRIVRGIVETSYVPGTVSTMEIAHDLPAMEHTAANDALFDRIAAYAKAHDLGEFRPIVRGGGSDSAYTTLIGIPTVCSMGAVGDGAHTVKEYAECASLPVRAKLLAGVISEL